MGWIGQWGNGGEGEGVAEMRRHNRARGSVYALLDFLMKY